MAAVEIRSPLCRFTKAQDGTDPAGLNLSKAGLEEIKKNSEKKLPFIHECSYGKSYSTEFVS